ncbi:MAG: nucleotidyl transferase AbiEii/AbiGii toxin family protein [Pseudomonadota bacterium]|nr:nucleotidyl transferase AbiEii/AbiGii toxin family protein [Pseudomonadota bacterium]
MKEFSPRTYILPAAQLRLWREFSAVPEEFVLYGGTAIALHLGHRTSVDFDFFGSRSLNLEALEGDIPFLRDAKIIQREKNTLTAIVDRGEPVKVSFFGVPNLRRLAQPHAVKENNLQIASLLDLAGTNASVIQVRAEAKDYLDMDAVLTSGKIDLPTALSAAQMLYGPRFNPQVTLKALSFFDDGNLQDLPQDLKQRLVDAVRQVDLDHLPALDRNSSRFDDDYEQEI